MSERSYITEIIGQNNEGIYIIKKSTRHPQRDVTLEHYSKDMRLLHSKNIATAKEEYYLAAFLQKENLQLAYVAEEKDSKKFALRVKLFDFNLNANTKDTTLLTMPGSDFSARRMQVFQPKGSNKSMFLYTSQDENTAANYNYLVIDSVLNTFFAGKLNIGIENNYEIENAVFSQDYIGILLRESVKRKVNKQGFQYYIAECRKGETDAKLFPLFNDSITVTEGILKTDYLNNAVAFAGLYNISDSSYAKGYCLWKHDLQDDKTTFTFSAFPVQIVEEMAGKNAKVHGLYRLRCGDLILRKDGGVVLTSEEYEETREAIMDMNMYGVSQTNFRYYFYYENLLVLSINNNGTLHWHTVLRKEQVSVNDNGLYSSYSVSAMQDKIVYIYNDLSRKSWNLSMYEVNADGKTSSKILLRAQDYNARLIPQYGRQMSYNEILMPAVANKGFILLKVKL